MYQDLSLGVKKGVSIWAFLRETYVFAQLPGSYLVLEYRISFGVKNGLLLSLPIQILGCSRKQNYTRAFKHLGPVRSEKMRTKTFFPTETATLSWPFQGPWSIGIKFHRQHQPQELN